MKFKDKLFEDAMNIAGGIFTSLQSLQLSMKNKFQEKAEECSAKLNLVSRDEFNHLLDMVSHLRQQQDLLMKKLELISDKLGKENKEH